jgi:flagellar basal body-associated protein FliL
MNILLIVIILLLVINIGAVTYWLYKIACLLEEIRKRQ